MHNVKIEIIRENNNKRLVKRTILLDKKGKLKELVDYCLQEKIERFTDDRWKIVYFNRSKKLVERRFLGL
jgi:hypothetical protein